MSLTYKDNRLISNHLVQVTTSSSHPDIITLNSGAIPVRAILPCGHAISPSSMTSYVQQTVKSSNFENIPCPACKMVLSLDIVKYVSCFDDQEWQQIKEKMDDIKFNRNPLYHRCPKCFSWCQRPSETYKTCYCHTCLYTFCIYCNTKYETICVENAFGGETFPHACNYTSQVPTGPTKQIEHQMGYTIRRCPKCKLLISHKEACKHMTCVNCKCQFCFICLATNVTDWGRHRNEVCALAAVQS